MTIDLNPIVLAVAAMIVACTPSVVGLIVAWGTHTKVSRIEHNTNGQLTALREEVATLQAIVAGRRTGDKEPIK